MDGQIDTYMHRKTDKWISEWRARWIMSESEVGGCMDILMDGQVDGWMDRGWMDRWMSVGDG